MCEGFADEYEEYEELHCLVLEVVHAAVKTLDALERESDTSIEAARENLRTKFDALPQPTEEP